MSARRSYMALARPQGVKDAGLDGPAIEVIMREGRRLVAVSAFSEAEALALRIELGAALGALAKGRELAGELAGVGQAYHGEYPIRHHRTLAEVDGAEADGAVSIPAPAAAIIAAVADETGVPVEAIMGRSRRAPIARARHSAILLLRWIDVPGGERRSRHRIAGIMRLRDHSSVVHALAAAWNRAEREPRYRRQLAAMVARVTGGQ